jgi:hypothetical protein
MDLTMVNTHDAHRTDNVRACLLKRINDVASSAFC